MKILPFLNYSPLKLANERAERANSNNLWEVVFERQTYTLGARKRDEKNCSSGNRTLDPSAERLASCRLRYQDVSQDDSLEVFQLNLSQSIRFISLSSPKYVRLATLPPTGCLNLPALLSHWLTSMANNSKRLVLSLHFFCKYLLSATYAINPRLDDQ